ncbi:transposase [Streptomyces sp. NPDC086989]|uniref:transposase n=1 Tax=Streptomyces sp. NPDC086989 TaxID=3365764 RepID=UPI003819F3BD
MRPGSRTRLSYRLLAHPAGWGKRRSMGESDFIALPNGVHQLVKAPLVSVWDRPNTHVSRKMRQMIDDRDWLTVFLLPTYSPDLNPVEGVWPTSNAAWPTSPSSPLDGLETLLRNLIKRLQHRFQTSTAS